MPLGPAPPSTTGASRLSDWPAWRAILTRWGISIASLVAGILTLVVFRRGLPHVAWIIGYIVVLWLVATVLAQTRTRFETRGHRRILAAGDYTVQTLYHGLLVFVLPGYFASTTLDALTAPFFCVLVAVALLTAVDPWYQALVLPCRWRRLCFFAISVFAGLNVALPLGGMPPAWALYGSALGAGLAVTSVSIRPGWTWRSVGAWGGLTILGAVALAWLLGPAIPPAPLHLVKPELARAVVDLVLVEPLGPRVSVAALGAGGVVAYTPVAAPAGLRQPVVHAWRHEGRLVTTVALPSPILGGRAGGFRTYSRKTDFPPNPQGRWSVDVVTTSGQLIGRLRFTVVP